MPYDGVITDLAMPDRTSADQALNAVFAGGVQVTIDPGSQLDFTLNAPAQVSRITSDFLMGVLR